jgi:hypothetical protein
MAKLSKHFFFDDYRWRLISVLAIHLGNGPRAPGGTP